MKISSRYEEFLPGDEEASNAASAKQIRYLERARSLWRAPGRAASRLQWVMIKHEKFEALTSRLVSYNDAVESILDRASLQDLHTMQGRSNLLLLQLTDQVSRLHTLTKALDIKVISQHAERDDVSQTSTLEQSPSDSSPHLNSLTAFKIQNLTLTGSSKDMLIKLSNPYEHTTNPSDARSMATYEQKRVFIEWRTPLDQGTSPEGKELIETRLSQLPTLLNTVSKPAEFRSPLCIGYCYREDDDEIQCGLVFDASSLGGPDSVIETLRQSLDRPPPSLTRRIKLATAITESILYLHAVKWLHKGLRSDSIIFSTHGDLASPLISGFDFSRPDASNEITVKSTSQARHDYYKHPQLLQHSNARSEKSHDIYALGIVLLEIALWKLIEDIMAIIQKKPLTTSQIPRIRERILTG